MISTCMLSLELNGAKGVNLTATSLSTYPSFIGQVFRSAVFFKIEEILNLFMG